MSEEVDEALERARDHLLRAALEGIEAARALAEAAARSSGFADGSEDSIAENVKKTLENLRAALRENASYVFPSRFTEPLAEALESEIKRWERRSRTDEDARLVLRAFLGMRELLWDLGMRHETEPPRQGTPPKPRNAKRSRPASESARATPRRERVQRFDVED